MTGEKVLFERSESPFLSRDRFLVLSLAKHLEEVMLVISLIKLNTSRKYAQALKADNL